MLRASCLGVQFRGDDISLLRARAVTNERVRNTFNSQFRITLYFLFLKERNRKYTLLSGIELFLRNRGIMSSPHNSIPEEFLRNREYTLLSGIEWCGDNMYKLRARAVSNN